MRRAAKRDGNESAVIAALETDGWTVESVSCAGLPDLLITKGGGVDVLEVKQADDSSMTAAQVKVHARWEASRCRIPVVTSGAEAVAVLRGERPPRTYRDFPWEGVPEAERRKRLALKPTGR